MVGNHMEKISIGNKVKALRKRGGVTRKDLANDLEIKYSTLANYENDIRNIPLDVLIDIAGYFDVPVDFFSAKTTNDYREWAEDTSRIKKAFSEARYKDMTELMASLGDAWGKDAPMLYREFIKGNRKDVPLEDIMASYFDELNQIGKREAIKRIEELTHIDKYIRSEDNSSAPSKEESAYKFLLHLDGQEESDYEFLRKLEKDLDENKDK